MPDPQKSLQTTTCQVCVMWGCRNSLIELQFLFLPHPPFGWVGLNLAAPAVAGQRPAGGAAADAEELLRGLMVSYDPIWCQKVIKHLVLCFC